MTFFPYQSCARAGCWCGCAPALLREGVMGRRTQVVGARSRTANPPSTWPRLGLRHIAGTACSTKRYLNIELLEDQQIRDAIMA